MAGYFGFGAFSTQIGQMIEQATDNSASAGNIGLHLQICDAIVATDNGPKDAVAAFKKRFTGSAKNFHIINLTLTVLETCVKNCGIRFHAKIAQKDFLKDLIGVINPKNNPPTIVRERVLGLIQYWADAFKNKPELSGVQELYQQMKEDGTEFPPVDLDTLAPVELPEKPAGSLGSGGQLELVQPGSVPSSQGSGGGSSNRGGSGGGRSRQSRRPLGPLKPEQIAKLLSELDVVRRNLDVMSELLVENDPGHEKDDDFSLMQELNTTLREMQERVTALIGRVQDEIVLESLLQINDELNQSFTRYDRHMKNRQAVKTGAVETTSEDISAPMPPPIMESTTITYPSLDVPPSYNDSQNDAYVGQLIDFGTDTTPSANVPTQQDGDQLLPQLAGMGISGEQQQQPDEFDMFAQSRLAYSNTGGSTYDDNLQEQAPSLSSAVHRQPQPEPTLYENNWGLTPPPTTSQQQPDDQATSAEFDQFLAQRASKSRHRPQMQREDDATDELFQL